jgi:hypothetical protein
VTIARGTSETATPTVSDYPIINSLLIEVLANTQRQSAAPSLRSHSIRPASVPAASGMAARVPSAAARRELTLEHAMPTTVSGLWGFALPATTKAVLATERVWRATRIGYNVGGRIQLWSVLQSRWLEIMLSLR